MMRWAQGLMIGGFLTFIVGMGLLYGEPAPDPIIVRGQAGGAPIAPDGHQRLAGMGTGTLDAAERTELQQVRAMTQETHDLLSQLHDQHPLPVLASTRAATGTHLTVLDQLHDRYNVSQADSSTSQQQYDGPAAIPANATGSLRAAARAQEQMITGLDTALNRTDDTDARLVYRSLRAASSHQLRALVRQLAMRGVDYRPVALSEDQLHQLTAPG